jgi:hypothetical protein
MKPLFLGAAIIALSTALWVTLLTLRVLPDPFPGDQVSIFRWPAILFDAAVGIFALRLAKVSNRKPEEKE